MLTWKPVLAAAALVAATATTASAVTTINDLQFTSPNAAGIASVTTGLAPKDEMKVDFVWQDAPASGFIEFTTNRSFELYIDAYTPSTRTDSYYSGFVLKDSNGVGYFEDTNFCSSGFVFEEIRGRCSLVTGLAGIETSVYKPTLDTAVGTFEAGTYFLGFYESEDPSSGGITFRTAEVPLPAAGGLLLAGLGGIAALRRRKKA